MRSVSKSGHALGLVLGGDEFVAVTVRPERDSFRIVSVSNAPPPPDAIEGVNVLDPPKAANSVRTIHRRMNSDARSLTVSLPAPGYGLRTIRLPDVPAREQRLLARGELESAGTLPQGAGGMDFIWSPIPSAEDKHQADVFAYYASDSTLDALHQLVRGAGLQLDAVEPSSLSMMRGYLACAGFGRPIALLCPAEKHADLCIHDGTRIRHLRRIPAGVVDITGSGAPTGAVDFSTQVSARSAPESSRPAWESSDTGFGGAVNSLLAPEEVDEEDEAAASGLQSSGGAAFITLEINRTLAFHSRERGADSTPGFLVVLASEDVRAAVSEQLSGNLTIPIDTSDPIREVAWPADVQGIRQEHLLAALGSALGTAGMDFGIPLVDVSQQEQVATVRRRAPSWLLAGMAGSTVWMIAAAAAAITLAVLENNTLTRLNDVKAEIERIEREQAAGIRYRDLMAAVQTIRRESQVPADSVLGRVAASLTPGVSITGVTVKQGKVDIDGKASGTGPVQTFAYALGRGRSVVMPYIESLKRESGGTLTFRIVGTTGGSVPAAAPTGGQ